jgi:pimeloyl-ACP methyl ester carboxylesterase
MKLLFLILMAIGTAAAPLDPPGVLVDLGGRRLHLWCSGAGAPAVILEAGAGAFSIDWALVQPQIAGSNRVCSYDRAGLGWSDSGPNAGKPDAIVADLHALLAAAGVKPPYVMVGASMGGIYARLYDLAYPAEVAGMVLVDPASEERLFTMYQRKGVTIASLTAEQLRSTISSERVVVPRRPAQTGEPFDRLPPELYEARVALETRLISSQPESVSSTTVLASAEAERAALARLHAFASASEHPLGGLPLIVLSRGLDASRDTQNAHAALARQSSNSRHEVVPAAGHEIHLFQPSAVARAIQDVVASVRNRTPLAKIKLS